MTASDRLAWPPVDLAAIEVYQDPCAPLTRTADAGSVVDVLYWAVRGLDGRPTVVVHPDRWNEFQVAAAGPPVESARNPPVTPARPFLWLADEAIRRAARSLVIGKYWSAIADAFGVPTVTTVCAQGPGSGLERSLQGQTDDRDQ
jgi:hypothetical protein